MLETCLGLHIFCDFYLIRPTQDSRQFFKIRGDKINLDCLGLHKMELDRNMKWMGRPLLNLSEATSIASTWEIESL